MNITAKEYLDMIATDLGEMFPGAAVRSEEDSEMAVLAAKYTLPSGNVTDVFVTLSPAENNMLSAQVIADLSEAIQSDTENDLAVKLFDINNNFTYGSVITGTDGDNRYCIYNYGFFLDTGLDLSDITLLLGRSITDAELEFCSEEVNGLFGTVRDTME